MPRWGMLRITRFRMAHNQYLVVSAERLGAADAPVPLEPLLGHAAADIVPQGLPLIPILPGAPEHVPAASDGTRYALREKVRFFDPFRYGASCVEVHEEVEVTLLAYM